MQNQIQSINEKNDLVAQKRIERLNSLLYTIRRVNEIIIHEKDRNNLIKDICENLVQMRGYNYSLIILMDDNLKYIKHAESGMLLDSNGIIDDIKNGNLPECINITLREKKAFININYETCNSCYNKIMLKGKSIFINRLVSNGQLYGLLYLVTDSDQLNDEEEQGLLNEVSGDVAFALYNIELEKRLRMLSKTVEQSTDSIVITSPDGIIEYVNQKFSITTGYSSEEIIGKKPNILSAGLTPKEIYKDLWDTIRSGKEWKGEFYNKKKNGEFFWESANISPIYDTEGKLKYLLGVHEDITEKKKNEEYILLQTRLLDSIGQSVIAMTLDRKLIYYNKTAEKLHGWKKDEVIGKSIEKIVKTSITDEQGKEIMSNLLSGKEWINEIFIQNKEGEEFPVILTISPFFDLKNNLTGIIGISTDISERKKAEIELKEAKERAEDMNRLKSSFLANMSHELRTPMIGILGFAEILFNETSDENIREKVQIISESGNRLMDTLNMILDLSKIEANKSEINFKRINASEAAENVVKTYSAAASRKGIILEPDIKNEIYGILDERIFMQIIRNLLSNAVKYTDNGKVNISLSEDIVNNNRMLKIVVSDTGIGISQEKQKIIFDPFRQVSEGFNRRYEGTGLGLTITKKFVDLMKGDIFVHSVPGTGSTFIVNIPLLQDEVPENIKESILQKESSSKNNTGERIPAVLLVEDDHTSKTVISMFLKNICQIDLTSNGEDAIEMAKKKKYDIILMDVNLEGKLDGLETTGIIRSIDGYINTPVVAITAYALTGDKELFIKKGCTHYLSKPFTRKELTELMTDIIDNEDFGFVNN